MAGFSVDIIVEHTNQAKFQIQLCLMGTNCGDQAVPVRVASRTSLDVLAELCTLGSGRRRRTSVPMMANGPCSRSRSVEGATSLVAVPGEIAARGGQIAAIAKYHAVGPGAVAAQALIALLLRNLSLSRFAGWRVEVRCPHFR